MSQQTVMIHKNEAGAKPFPVSITDMKMKKFLTVCKRTLGLKDAQKIYLHSGAEITHMEEIHPNDRLYISAGEPFFKSGAVKDGAPQYQISVLGSGGVGKSALTLRFVRDVYPDYWDPTIEDAYLKQIEVDGQSVYVNILDTAGQEEFESLRSQWIKSKDGFVFVFSLDSMKSLTDLNNFFNLYQEIHQTEKPPIVLAANKKDFVTDHPEKLQVLPDKIAATSRAFHAIDVIETSAATSLHVNDLFTTCVRAIIKAKNPKKQQSCCDIL